MCACLLSCICVASIAALFATIAFPMAIVANEFQGIQAEDSPVSKLPNTVYQGEGHPTTTMDYERSTVVAVAFADVVRAHREKLRMEGGLENDECYFDIESTAWHG